MNSTTEVRLNGTAYRIEEPALKLLRSYLDAAKAKLALNPDIDEIMSDIEAAISQRCRLALQGTNPTLTTNTIGNILSAMGPVEDESASPPVGAQSRPPYRERRLYRLMDGRQLGGVCNGLAAHLEIDVGIVRLLFLAGCVFSLGTIAILYLLLEYFIPVAKTPEQIAAATGRPQIAQELVDRAKEGYYRSMEYMREKTKGTGIRARSYLIFTAIILFTAALFALKVVSWLL